MTDAVNEKNIYKMSNVLSTVGAGFNIMATGIARIGSCVLQG